MPRELTAKEKKRFITLKYFGTTDNPDDDVNPFDSVSDFLSSTVGSLNWGTSPVVRRNSKMRFAFNFHQVLGLFKVVLPPADIMTIIDDDDLSNEDAADEFILKSTFPKV